MMTLASTRRESRRDAILCREKETHVQRLSTSAQSFSTGNRRGFPHLIFAHCGERVAISTGPVQRLARDTAVTGAGSAASGTVYMFYDRHRA